MRVKNGSAMVITLLLLATVGSISFAIGRLFILDLTISRIYDDSVVAYYAAESGVEEGLLRYRLNKNSEVEAGNPGEADGYNNVVRNDLSKLTKESLEVSATAGLPNPAERFYDFRMYFLEKELCNLDAGNQDSVCDKNEAGEWIKIPANESKKFDITGIEKNDYDLWLRPGVSDSIAFEAKIVASLVGSNEPEEHKKFFITSGLRSETSVDISSDYKIISPSGSYYKVQKIAEKLVGTKPVDFGDFSDPNMRAELYIKPIKINGTVFSSGDLEMMIKRSNEGRNNNASIAGQFSTVKSVGHYGNVTRTLKAMIDRQSGTLYDVFDFVLYEY